MFCNYPRRLLEIPQPWIMQWVHVSPQIFLDNRFLIRNDIPIDTEINAFDGDRDIKSMHGKFLRSCDDLKHLRCDERQCKLLN